MPIDACFLKSFSSKGLGGLCVASWAERQFVINDKSFLGNELSCFAWVILDPQKPLIAEPKVPLREMPSASSHFNFEGCVTWTKCEWVQLADV